MADFIIRAASQEDFPKIRSLIHAVKINPTGLDWRRFLVAITASGSFLGCGQIKPHSDGSKELASIAVQENSRGRGIARMIIMTLVELEVERPLYLMCRARLESYYNKFGFRTITLEIMSPYFKRICRLERIFNYASQADNRLLVMRLE